MVYIDYPIFNVKVGFSQSAEFGNPKLHPQQYDNLVMVFLKDVITLHKG